MPTSARARHRIGTGGPWGSGLLLLGIAVIVQGIGYAAATPDRLPPAIEQLSQYVPPVGWGAVWIGVGGWSVYQALTPPQQHWQVLPVVGVLSMWSAAYLLHWLYQGIFQDHWTRSWNSAIGWAMLAGLIICWGRCVNPPRSIERP